MKRKNPTPDSETSKRAHGTSSRPENEISHWLMKAEPESRIVKGRDVKFGIDDLASMPDQTSPWDGVRNYEARNLLRDQMRVGDLVLFYHSNCKCPGVAGIARIVKEGYPDYTAFDSKHPYYDPKFTDQSNPRWYMVDVQFVKKFKRLVSLNELKQFKDTSLKSMVLLNRGRLSVQPCSKEEFEFVVKLSEEPGPDV